MRQGCCLPLLSVACRRAWEIMWGGSALAWQVSGASYSTSQPAQLHSSHDFLPGHRQRRLPTCGLASVDAEYVFFLIGHLTGDLIFGCHRSPYQLIYICKHKKRCKSWMDGCLRSAPAGVRNTNSQLLKRKIQLNTKGSTELLPLTQAECHENQVQTKGSDSESWVGACEPPPSSITKSCSQSAALDLGENCHKRAEEQGNCRRQPRAAVGTRQAV